MVVQSAAQISALSVKMRHFKKMRTTQQPARPNEVDVNAPAGALFCLSPFQRALIRIFSRRCLCAANQRVPYSPAKKCAIRSARHIDSGEPANCFILAGTR